MIGDPNRGHPLKLPGDVVAPDIRSEPNDCSVSLANTPRTREAVLDHPPTGNAAELKLQVPRVIPQFHRLTAPKCEHFISGENSDNRVRIAFLLANF